MLSQGLPTTMAASAEPKFGGKPTEANVSRKDTARLMKNIGKDFNMTTIKGVFDKAKKHVPNVKVKRTGSQASINEEREEDGFSHPNKTARRSSTSSDSAASTQVNNRFQPLENMECGESTEGGATSTQQPKRTKIKTPPVYIADQTIKGVAKLLLEKEIGKGDFTLRQVDAQLICIGPKDMQAFDKIIELLKTDRIKFHTYTPKHLKTKTLVLKGIRGGYDEGEVKTDIDSLKIDNVKVNKVSKLRFNKERTDLYHFLVHLECDSAVEELLKLKYLLNQRVRWEKLRKPRIFQCKNCQDIGHASSNCNRGYKCVKCAQSHGPGKCSLTNKDNKELLLCANCGEKGHPASYRGCPFLKFADNLKKKSQQKKNAVDKAKVNKIYRTIDPQLSFANVTQHRYQPRREVSDEQIRSSQDNHNNSQTIGSPRETKLNERHILRFDNYDIVRNDRAGSKKGGGTAIIIKSSINYSEVTYPSADNNKVIEYTCIKVGVNKNSLYCFSLYANHADSHIFAKELERLFLDHKLMENDNFYIIAGDFNARHTCWGDSVINDRGRQFKKWDMDFGATFKSKIYPPVQATFPKSGSYLDYCIADNRIEFKNTTNDKLSVLAYDSDHYALFFQLDTSSLLDGLSAIKEQRISYNYKRANWVKFGRFLDEQLKVDDEAPTNRNLSIVEIDEHISKLEQLIISAIKKIIPKVDPEKWKYYEKYENNTIKKLHSFKSFLVSRLHYIKYKSPLKHSRQEISRVKNTIGLINKKLAKEFRRSITAYWSALIKSINYRNSLQFFPMINRLLRPSKAARLNNFKIKVNDDPFSKELCETYPHLVNNNNEIIISDPLIKLEVIGRYLERINSPRYTNSNTSTKVSADKAAQHMMDLKNKLRNDNQTFTEFSDENLAYKPSLEVLPSDKIKFLFSEVDVFCIIKNLKNKTSSGLDNIPAVVIKHIPERLIREYTIIFNNAINHAYYPTRWKMAKVLPILKKGKDPLEPQSYRPISLTMNFSKIFEKLIKECINNHIKKHEVIPDNQFGFKTGHSTNHAIHKFSSDINNYLHEGLTVGAVLLDLEKAFDSVWRNGLIHKLLIYKFPVGLILLILDMIQDKTFRTWDGTLLSDTVFKITEGLQQGTVTSPILFNIFNSEVINLFGLNSEDRLHSIAYADDLVVYKADQDVNRIQETLQQVVNSINTYYKDWNLKINPTKSELIYFRRPVKQIKYSTVTRIKKSRITARDIHSNQVHDIPAKKIVKYLGVHMDYLFRLNTHHNIQLEKAIKTFRANGRIFFNSSLEKKAKIICYMLLVRPIITYAAPVLWNTGPTIMEKLRRFERLCLRTCLRAHRTKSSGYTKRTSNLSIYEKAEIPRIDCFMLKLTRRHFGNLVKVENKLLEKVRDPDSQVINEQLASGYIPPEGFKTCDAKGLIQDAYNLPIIYHVKRHSANKSINVNRDLTRGNLCFATDLPNRDIVDTNRASDKYTWLKDAKYLDEIRRRAKKKERSRRRR